MLIRAKVTEEAEVSVCLLPPPSLPSASSVITNNLLFAVSSSLEVKQMLAATAALLLEMPQLSPDGSSTNKSSSPSCERCNLARSSTNKMMIDTLIVEANRTDLPEQRACVN